MDGHGSRQTTLDHLRHHENQRRRDTDAGSDLSHDAFYHCLPASGVCRDLADGKAVPSCWLSQLPFFSLFRSSSTACWPGRTSAPAYWKPSWEIARERNKDKSSRMRSGPSGKPTTFG